MTGSWPDRVADLAEHQAYVQAPFDPPVKASARLKQARASFVPPAPTLSMSAFRGS